MKVGKKDEYPKKIRFDGVSISMARRGNDGFILNWREGGKWKSTSRSDEKKAIKWAETKARELARGTGRKWITPGEAEVLESLRKIALQETGNSGEEASEGLAGFSRVVGLLRESVEILKPAGGIGKLRAAAEYYVSHGPGAVAAVSLYEALVVVRAEYDRARGATKNTMHVALDGMKRLIPDKSLTEVSREDLERYVFEPKKAVRTQRNRMSTAGTFFERCKTLGMWPEARPLPLAGIKKPRLPDVAPEIFTVEEGEKILKMVRKDCPRYLTYLILAGWCGCRPSECLRLRWGAIDLEHEVMHLSWEVVGKTARERWVPLDHGVAEALRKVKAETKLPTEADDRVCLTRAREELSLRARKMGLKWPADVLRHSAITYTLQVLGNDYNKTAERMGNSPKVIESNYRRPIPAGMGEKWFSLLG